MFLDLEDDVRHGHIRVSMSIRSWTLHAELWITFGVGKLFRSLLDLNQPRYLVLIIALHCQCSVYAFTGCDTVSYLGDENKNSAWDTWKACKELPLAFCALAARLAPQNIQDWFGPLERVVILLYDWSSSQECVNEARKQLLTQKERTIEGLSPTQAALTQHITRAA